MTVEKKSILTPEVTGFIDGLAELSTEQWQTVIEGRRRRTIDGSYAEALETPRPSAAERAAIERRVLATLRPNSATVNAAGRVAFMNATTASKLAAQALQHRERMTPDDLATLLDPFREAGVVVDG